MARAKAGAAGAWRTTTARAQGPLDGHLAALVQTRGADAVLVVTRTGDQRTRALRRLGPPSPVMTLAEFLQRAGPDDIRDEDLLPGLVVHRIVERAMPRDYQGPARAVARRHLTDQVVRARHLLAANDAVLLPDAAARVRGDLVRALAAADAAVPARLLPLHADGLVAADEVVLRAAAGPSGLPARFPTVRVVAFTGFDTVSAAERRAIVAVTSGHVEVRWFVVAPGPDTPQPALALCAPLAAWLATMGSVEDLGDAPRTRMLSGLFALEPRPPTALPDVHVLRPRTLHDEVDAAVHGALRCIANGAAPSEVGIVVPRLGQYATVLGDRLREAGLAFAMSHPGPLRETPSGTLLRLLLENVKEDCPRDAFIDLALHPLVRLGHAADAPPRFDARWLARALAARGLRPRGAEAWTRALQRLRTAPGIRLDDEGEWIEEPTWGALEERHAAAAVGLLALVATVRDAGDASSMVDALRVAIDRLGIGEGVATAVRADPAHAPWLLSGHMVMLDVLDEAEASFDLLEEDAPRVAEAIEALQRLLWRAVLPPIGDADHGVQVLGLRNARGVRFRHVFLLGARQGDLPAAAEDDALHRLLGRASGAVLERFDPDAEARRILHGLLAETEGTVTLSCPATEGDADVVRSILLDELEDAFVLDPPPPPDKGVHAPRLLHRAAGLQDIALHPAPAVHAAARLLVAARAAATNGAYNGHLSDPDAIAWASGRFAGGAGPVSASRIDVFAACPFRSLFTHVLGLAALPERDGHIGPLDKGNLIHGVLHRYTRDALVRCGTPFRIADDPHAEARLVDASADLFEAAGLDGLHADALKIQLLSGLRAAGNPYAGRPAGLLRRFLDDERRAGRLILAAEVAYGRDHPVTLEGAGAQIAIHGRIDRIDLFPEGPALGVVDYKTGRLPDLRLAHGGVSFQLPFYAIGAAALHPGRPVRSAGYVQIKRPRRGDMRRVDVPGRGDDPGVLDALLARTPQRVASIRLAVSTGNWNLTLLDPTAAGCDHCDHRRVCGLRPHLQDARARMLPELRSSGAYVPDAVAKEDA